MAPWPLPVVLCFIHDHSDRTGRRWSQWCDERPLDPATRFFIGLLEPMIRQRDPVTGFAMPPKPMPWIAPASRRVWPSPGYFHPCVALVEPLHLPAKRLWTGPYFDPLTRCVQLGDGFAMRPGGPLLGPGVDAAPELAAAAAKLKARWLDSKLSITGIPVAALREPLPRDGGVRREITVLERIDLDICDFDGAGPKLYWLQHIGLSLLSNASPAFVEVLFVDTEVSALFGPQTSPIPSGSLSESESVDVTTLPDNQAGRVAKKIFEDSPGGPPIMGIKKLARHHGVGETTIRTAMRLLKDLGWG
jgi:hypothetical protein